MARTSVGILRGGTSGEYDMSLKTGAAMMNALPESEYDVRDILIDKSGMWHSRGFPAEPARALSQVDVVLNALHGGVGEDGTVQRILDQLGVPYVGSNASASALSLNKIQAGMALEKAGLQMPRALSFTTSKEMDTGSMAKMVFAQFGPPYMIKPPHDGASIGLRVAPNVVELPEVLGDVLDAYGTALVEEFLLGKEATVAVLEGYRGEDLYVFPPAEVVYPDESPFLHFDHHVQGHVKYIVPSNFSDVEKRALMEMARDAHRALGLSHFSRADFILTRRGPYLLEVNSLPGLHENAGMPKIMESVGTSLQQFLTHAIGLAWRY